MDAQQELSALSLAFVMALTKPQTEMTDNMVAWQGVMALFAASRIPGLIPNTEGLQIAVKRLQKLGA